MTNREYLNNLSNKEMSMFIEALAIMRVAPCGCCAYTTNSCDGKCTHGILNWLEMEKNDEE